ncbi:MAG: hemolysin family protein [Bryobacteraceae bacterium]|nr:hemolysin family protein [Bryobacteraceae bacterium]
MIYKLLLFVIVTAVNGFFAAAEVALISTRRSRLESLARDGNLGAQAALKLLANPERLLSVVQVGIGICALALGQFEELFTHQIQSILLPLAPAALTHFVHGFSVFLSFLLLTLTLVVAGEVVPKNIGFARAEKLAVIAAPILLIIFRASEPFVIIVERLAAALSRLLGAKGHGHSGAHSAEELKFIVASSHQEGFLPAFERQAIQRLLDLDDYVAREIMVPRRDIVSIPLTSSLDQVLKAMTESHHSRIPVYDGKPENLMGIVHFRDLLDVWHQRRMATEKRRAVPPFQLVQHVRKAFVIPETKPLNQLVDEFRRGHAHMAFVVDEFGTIAGLLTLEDVLEQVFGEIEDEHDVPREPIVWEASVVELEGSTPIRDLSALHGIELPTDGGFETLAGFLLFHFGYIPGANSQLEQEGLRFTILEMDRNRIKLVRIERLDAEPGVISAPSLA